MNSNIGGCLRSLPLKQRNRDHLQNISALWLCLHFISTVLKNAKCAEYQYKFNAQNFRNCAFVNIAVTDSKRLFLCLRNP